MKKISIQLILLTIVFCFTFSACIEEMEFDESLLEPKLIVNVFLSPQNIFFIKLLHNQPLNSDPNESNGVSDAIVYLYEDGKEVKELERRFFNNYYYNENNEWTEDLVDTTFFYLTESIRPEIGKKYELVVESKKFGKVRCETIIPEPVDILSLDTSSVVQTRGDYSYEEQNFKLRFKDPVESENYYRIILTEITGELTQSWEDSTIEYIQVHGSYGSIQIYSEDPIFSYQTQNANSFALGGIDNEYNIFTDKTINGEEYELTFNFSQNNKQKEIDTTIGEFIQHKVQLQSISKDMYYYLKSIDLQDYAIEFPFAEPIPVYTNVENGMGILGSFSAAIDSITYGQYPKEGVTYDGDIYSNPIIYY